MIGYRNREENTEQPTGEQLEPGKEAAVDNDATQLVAIYQPIKVDWLAHQLVFFFFFFSFLLSFSFLFFSFLFFNDLFLSV